MPTVDQDYLQHQGQLKPMYETNHPSPLAHLEWVAKWRWPGHDFAKDCECKSCRSLRADFVRIHFDAIKLSFEATNALEKDRGIYGTSYARIDADGAVTRIDPATVMIVAQPGSEVGSSVCSIGLHGLKTSSTARFQRGESPLRQ